MTAAPTSIAVARALVPPASPRTSSDARAGAVPVARGRPALDAEIESSVRRRFDTAAAQDSEAAMGALRASVTLLVDRLKARGLSSVDVVDAVEALLREHGVSRRGPALLGGGEASRPSSRVATHVLRWAVRAYHDDAWW